MHYTLERVEGKDGVTLYEVLHGGEGGRHIVPPSTMPDLVEKLREHVRLVDPDAGIYYAGVNSKEAEEFQRLYFDKT